MAEIFAPLQLDQLQARSDSSQFTAHFIHNGCVFAKHFRYPGECGFCLVQDSAPRGGVGTVDPRQDQVCVRWPQLAG